MDVLQEYKCPCCGGALNFDSETQKMKCPYCDTEFEIEALKAENLDREATDKTDNMDWENKNGEDLNMDSEGLKVYVCKSCGGEIICEETTAASSCPYCSNPVIMNENLSGTLRPDLVIPFKLDKNAAKEALKNHLKGKILLPKVFKNENHIEEIKGIYVPFWLFDADVDAAVKYRGTKVRTWSDSKYYYTKTSYYSLFRSGNIAFSNVPADASKNMADDLMDSIEPYDMKDAVDFKTAYLSGYFADKYDVSASESTERVNRRIKKSTEDAFMHTITGYSSINTESSSVSVSDGKTKYALLPVWILNTKWKDNMYTFAMNGQTGKFVGNLPMDKGAFFRVWALASGLIGILAFSFFMIFK